jgi:hypothetical protein
MIILRAVYRVIELAQGWRGYLITHEVYFYCLDTAPMIICMAVWVLGHPGITLGKEILQSKKGQYAVALESGGNELRDYHEYRNDFGDVDLRNGEGEESQRTSQEELRSHEK